ncbi:uncharacterized protein cenpt isoform X2 [Toxotes jaculatrix]|uniref:uncharacterized protein cenpt isoform X2 n=1 Tax=Toxotes jaculatrix TaxID=941984 RepID=UPI001B3AFEE3|nr:uncharacterized protein cenpt isoform X2 [Toxotes jaculatrix]
MDQTEDLSARVLLKNILSTEPPRTPITRSASNVQSASGIRRSNRLSKKDAGAQTPQDILRRSLKHKVRESITRKSLPATKRRTTSVVLRKNTPAPSSMLFDDGDTPRHILRNILLTEPVKSPVVHERAGSEEPQLPSANSSITSKRPSIELSGLDLPDLTIGNAASIAKGLSRKRPRRSLNVTAFEKRLKDGNDVEEENEKSVGDLSSLSLSSSNSLSLKTPFVDVWTEKRGLQRKVPNRRKITEEEFGAAVNKRQLAGDHGVSRFEPVEGGLNETTYSEGFTLGLSPLSEPDITTDIVNCDTALYTHPDAMTSNYSIVATQDKPTVMASQLQRQMRDMEQMEAEQSKMGEEKSVYVFPAEEGIMAETQNEECAPESESQKDVDAAECLKGEGRSTADGLPDAAAMLKSKEEEGVAESQAYVSPDTTDYAVEAQTDEEGAADLQTEGDAACRSQSEEEEAAPDSHTEEVEGGVDSQFEEDVAAKSQSEEEEVVPDSQAEEEHKGADDSQSEEDVEARSQSEEDVGAAESQTEEKYDGMQEEEEGSEQASEQLEHDLEHITRRAHRSEGGLIMPVTETGGYLTDNAEAGWSEGKSKTHSTMDLHHSLKTGSHESSQPLIGMTDWAESSTQGQKDAPCTEARPDADKENSFPVLEMTHGIEDNGHPSDASSEEAAGSDPAEQEEELEDEDDDDESEEFPCKTPAFVREKRKFFQPDPQASPSVLKNIQTSTGEALPGSKPKKVQQRKRGPTNKEAGLPKNYLMGVFKHFAKMKVSADVYPVLKQIMDKFFDRLADDLETYAGHAKRKTIEVEDAELLLKRQGYVNDKVPVEVLIEKYLRMEQRKLLIPIATSGNVVVPKKRR